MTFYYPCPECGSKTQVTCLPAVAARTYGDPMDCYPAEPAEVDPSACEECGLKFEVEAVFEAAPERDCDNDREEREDERRME